MHGELSGFMRLFSIVKSMDSLVGPDFEKGLARLKRVAESGLTAAVRLRAWVRPSSPELSRCTPCAWPG